MTRVYTTLVFTDDYVPGALVLAHTLRAHRSSYPITCLYVPDSLSRTCITLLEETFDSLHPVPELSSDDPKALALLGRPELGPTLTKIHIWALPYDRVVFLDADTMPLRNIDDLFEREGRICAAPDAGWPDCFNSGVFVTSPDTEIRDGLLKLMAEKGSFDGGDQGLLNDYFSSWSTGSADERLPFTYNVTPSAFYSYAPALHARSSDMRILHFIGERKPWRWPRDYRGDVLEWNSSGTSTKHFVQMWWNMHDAHVTHWTMEEGGFSRTSALWYVQSKKPEEKQVKQVTHLPAFTDSTEATNFANYRISWGADVPNHPFPKLHTGEWRGDNSGNRSYVQHSHSHAAGIHSHPSSPAPPIHHHTNGSNGHVYHGVEAGRGGRNGWGEETGSSSSHHHTHRHSTTTKTTTTSSSSYREKARAKKEADRYAWPEEAYNHPKKEQTAHSPASSPSSTAKKLSRPRSIITTEELIEIRRRHDGNDSPANTGAWECEGTLIAGLGRRGIDASLAHEAMSLREAPLCSACGRTTNHHAEPHHASSPLPSTLPAPPSCVAWADQIIHNLQGAGPHVQERLAYWAAEVGALHDLPGYSSEIVQAYREKEEKDHAKE